MSWRNSSSRRIIAASPIPGSAAKPSRLAASSCPKPQLVGAAVSIAALAEQHFFINRTDFGRALEATREDAGAVALVGIDKNRVFALGWGQVRRWWASPAPSCRYSFISIPMSARPFALIAYVTVALGGVRQRVLGAFAGSIVVGLVRGHHRDDPAAVAEIGRHLCDLPAGGFVPPRGLFGRSGWTAISPNAAAAT